MFGETYKVTLVPTQYGDGNKAVQMFEQETGDSFGMLSVNLPESAKLPKDAFYVKHWSENAGFVKQLVAQNVLESVPALVVSSGFVLGIQAYRIKS
jgi:hypothetical protein